MACSGFYELDEVFVEIGMILVGALQDNLCSRHASQPQALDWHASQPQALEIQRLVQASQPRSLRLPYALYLISD
jgi:hypothetical protein